MKVFKASLLILKKKKATVILYFVIFISIFVFISIFTGNEGSLDFSQTKIKYTLINRDKGTVFYNGLDKLLSEKGNKIEIEDSKSAFQDAQFYNETEFLLIIPEGFEEDFFSGGSMPLEKITTDNSGGSYFADNVTTQFYNFSKAYLALDPQIDNQTLMDKVYQSLSKEVKVEMKSYSEYKVIDDSFAAYLRMAAYISLILLISCVSLVALAFDRPDIAMRNLCSPMKSSQINKQLLLVAFMFGALIWVVISTAGFILFRNEIRLYDTKVILILLGNLFVFNLVGVSISILVSSFIKGPSSQNAIGNMISLTLSFLGGVFVPTAIMSDSLLMIARFTPTYWYTNTADIASTATLDSPEKLKPILLGFVVQLAFAICFFALSIVVRKYYGSSEKRFVVNKTELEN